MPPTCGTSRARPSRRNCRRSCRGMLIDRARRPRQASAPRPSCRQPRFPAPGCGRAMRVDLADVAVDKDEVGPFAGSRLPIFSSAKLACCAAGEAGEGLLEADPLVQKPAPRRLAIDVLSTDGGRKAQEGVGLSTGGRNRSNAGLDDRTPGIGAGKQLTRGAFRPSAGRWSGAGSPRR